MSISIIISGDTTTEVKRTVSEINSQLSGMTDTALDAIPTQRLVDDLRLRLGKDFRVIAGDSGNDNDRTATLEPVPASDTLPPPPPTAVADIDDLSVFDTPSTPQTEPVVDLSDPPDELEPEPKSEMIAQPVATKPAKRGRPRKGSSVPSPSYRTEPHPAEVEAATRGTAEANGDALQTARDLLHSLYLAGNKEIQAQIRTLLANYQVTKFSEVPADRGPELLADTRAIQAAAGMR